MESVRSTDHGRCSFVEVMKSYQASYQGDNDILSLDAKLMAAAKDVECSSGLNRVKKFACHLTNSSNETANIVKSYETEILKPERNEVCEKILDKALIKEYFNISSKTLDLCEIELKVFIKSASEMASCIEENNCKLDQFRKAKNFHESARLVVTKVDSLRNQYQVMLNKLKTEIENIGKELKRSRFWEKAVNVMSIGVMFAVYLCGLIAPPVAAFIIGTVSLAEHWLLDMIKENQSKLETYKVSLESVETEARETNIVLDDIKRQVDELIETGNDASADLEKFKEDIKGLDKVREDCIPDLKKARKEILEKYRQVKS